MGAEEDLMFDASMFTNESYGERTFSVGEHSMRLLCSPSASTDFDLTGLGLPGILCAKFCPVILTDHNDVVLRVLQKNADLNSRPHTIRCRQLDWSADAGTFSNILAESPNRQGFELLLGSDVAYSLKALPSLFRAASLLLSKQSHSVFLLGYVSRAASIDRGIFLEAAAVGLRTREVPGTRKSVPGGLEGAVYEDIFAEASNWRSARREHQVPLDAGQAPAGSPQQVLPQPAPVAQAAAIHPPPQQEDPFVTAIRLLMQQGLPEAKARAALQRVPAAGRTLEGWVIAAIEWQTAQDDLEAEKRDLELAMQASLREEEERKSQQTPLEQQTPEQLLQHFKGSILLAALRKSPMADQLFFAPLLLPVLRLLKLEQQSCRWYASSGTRKYFEALAEECAVSEHSMHSSTEPAPTETPPSNSKRAPKRRRKSPCNKGADADAAAAEGASPSPEAAASVFQQFADFIDSKAAALEV
ncbi:hypothetical protein WJX75_001518 [Coccomyxa subellipsoidea]|uniref:Uncharacterized protein n=1 Tax=Coccomyxa subellipsoidea TaxID=248742 RepID=A0ABR2YH67_9CHLO